MLNHPADESRHDPERSSGRRVRCGFDDFAKALQIDVRGIGVDEIDIARRKHATARRMLRQFGIEAVDSKRGQRWLAVKDDHGRSRS